MHANSCRLLSSTRLPWNSTRSVVWPRDIQWPQQTELSRKKEKKEKRKKEKKQARRKDVCIPKHPASGRTLGMVLHPSILMPRGKRGTMAEPSSAFDIPSLHSAMVSCMVWLLSHTAEGHTNHFNQIRRSTKITEDQGEELKPIWGQQQWQHISGSRSGKWVISGFPLQI